MYQFVRLAHQIKCCITVNVQIRQILDENALKYSYEGYQYDIKTEQGCKMRSQKLCVKPPVPFGSDQGTDRIGWIPYGKSIETLGSDL